MISFYLHSNSVFITALKITSPRFRKVKPRACDYTVSDALGTRFQGHLPWESILYPGNGNSAFEVLGFFGHLWACLPSFASLIWPAISHSGIVLDETETQRGQEMIPRSTFQEVAATGLVAQPEFKSRISSLCQDSHPQKGEHEASFPARKAILTSSHTLNTGRGRGGKEQRKEGREGENTSIFFYLFPCCIIYRRSCLIMALWTQDVFSVLRSIAVRTTVFGFLINVQLGYFLSLCNGFYALCILFRDYYLV